MKQPSKKILTAALMSSIAVTVMVGCSKDTPIATKNESVSGSYNFSGAVLDGSGATNATITPTGKYGSILKPHTEFSGA